MFWSSNGLGVRGDRKMKHSVLRIWYVKWGGRSKEGKLFKKPLISRLVTKTSEILPQITDYNFLNFNCVCSRMGSLTFLQHKKIPHSLPQMFWLSRSATGPRNLHFTEHPSDLRIVCLKHFDGIPLIIVLMNCTNVSHVSIF